MTDAELAQLIVNDALEVQFKDFFVRYNPQFSRWYVFQEGLMVKASYPTLQEAYKEMSDHLNTKDSLS